MGGDEFVVLLPGVQPFDAGLKVAQFRDVVREIGESLFSGDVLTVSVGAAHFPIDGADAEQLAGRSRSPHVRREAHPETSYRHRRARLALGMGHHGSLKTLAGEYCAPGHT